MFHKQQSVKVDGYEGIAFRVIRHKDSIVECYMVGDDRVHRIHESNVSAIDDLDYCNVCGQIGCRHDGRIRT